MKTANLDLFVEPILEEKHHSDLEAEMQPPPRSVDQQYQGSQKLKGKVAIITGGDSGIGKAVAILFAKEGAKVVVVYLPHEEEDAQATNTILLKEGAETLLIAGDVGDESFCQKIIDDVMTQFGQIDILINNAAEQHPQAGLHDISPHQLYRTFQTNIFSYFFLSKAVLPHLKAGSCIINTASVTAYKGSPQLLDYSATKGAIVAFTRSLALNLANQRIRVNAVAPGPVWTPLIPSTFEPAKVKEFGQDVPLERPGQPEEIAPSFVFLASDDSSYISGQTLHPNGGEVVNG